MSKGAGYEVLGFVAMLAVGFQVYDWLRPYTPEFLAVFVSIGLGLLLGNVVAGRFDK